MAQFPELQPLHEPPPDEGILLYILRSLLDFEINLDTRRLLSVLHLGHSQESLDLEMGRIASKLLLHFGHEYSYIGIFFLI